MIYADLRLSGHTVAQLSRTFALALGAPVGGVLS